MKITIVGSGTAGLLSALVARNKLPKAKVIVIADPNTKVIGVGESTVGSFCSMLETSCGINIMEFIKEVKPVTKNGILFRFGKKDFHYTFSTSFDYQYHSKDFPEGFYFEGGDYGHSEYSKNMINNSNALSGNSTGALHIDNKLFLTYLTKLCNERNIKIISDKIISIQRDENHITSLNEKYVSDYFIDGSGFKPLLSNEEFYSYQNTLVNDKAIFFRTKTKKPIRSYTQSTTMKSGWLWEIDHSTGYSGNGYVYSSKYISDEQALKEVEQKLKIKIDNYRIIPFKTGRLKKHWVGNVITIGNTDGFVEPLEATSIMTILALITDVIDIIRYGDKKGDLIERYNKFANTYYDTIRDFILIHYCFNNKLNTPYWKDYKKRFTHLSKNSLAYDIIKYYLTNDTHLKYLSHVHNRTNAFELDGWYSILRGLIPTKTDRKKWLLLFK